MRRTILLMLAFVVSYTSALSSSGDKLLKDFQNYSEDQRVAVYWYWISDNISVEGVEHDLEAMKKAGIERAFIGHIWQDGVKPGNIKVLSPEWWEVLHAALKKATELDFIFAQQKQTKRYGKCEISDCERIRLPLGGCN